MAKIGWHSYDELTKLVGSVKDLNIGLDRLLDTGILTAAWKLNEKRIYERKFIMRE